ncbi:hypothetical protein BAE44_0008446 [Dichanthelium oligosanthes]|uniref:PGG domain-containing protein n=1 Tax=Dichanthelium oligosanthes TaxID=888268 RepID=A0A1E5VZK9_9POAL|nr:hypothetical protein BAE44_0008446 [Dichanthelium oligosanthes]
MSQGQDSLPWPTEYNLQKYLLLLATVVATVAYAAAFNPPGGAWKVADRQGYLRGGDDKGHRHGHLAGEPIIRNTHYLRFLVFFYCNAVEFASSIVVIIIILVLTIWHDLESTDGRNRPSRLVYGLRVAMVLDLIGLMGAYAAGTSQDEVTTKNDWVLVAVFFVFVVAHMVLWHLRGHTSKDDDKSHRKVVMVLATFITSITYTSGLSMPGGFWDSNQGGQSAGDPILQENHRYRLRAFFFCNTTSFAMSLVIIVLLMGKEILRWKLLYPYIAVALLGLVGAYAFGSCREIDNTIYVASLLAGAFLLFLLVFRVIKCCGYGKEDEHNRRPNLEDGLSEEPQQEQDQGNEDATRSRENNNPLGSENGQAAAAQQGQNGDASPDVAVTIQQFKKITTGQQERISRFLKYTDRG